MLGMKQSRKEIAAQLGISESTMGLSLSLKDYAKPVALPKVLSIDEFKGDTEYGKYCLRVISRKFTNICMIFQTGVRFNAPL